MRDKNTGTKEFRELVSETAMLICYEATRDLPLKEVSIETPLALAKSKVISGRKIAVIALLRAGLGMIEGVTALVPSAKIGHIGLYREDDDIVKYYSKLPEDVAERDVIILDAILATGKSANIAIKDVKNAGVKNIKFMCILSSPQGAQALEKENPDVEIYCGAMDSDLNDQNFIVPGVGDAGDRIYGTR